jgi:hypothetical protein
MYLLSIADMVKLRLKIHMGVDALVSSSESLYSDIRNVTNEMTSMMMLIMVIALTTRMAFDVHEPCRIAVSAINDSVV